jgi:hypothetical protein
MPVRALSRWEITHVRWDVGRGGWPALTPVPPRSIVIKTSVLRAADRRDGA